LALLRMALRSPIGPLMHGARRLPSSSADLLARFRFPPGTHLIEGLNHTIQFH
jgi:hypothetical protein